MQECGGSGIRPRERRRISAKSAEAMASARMEPAQVQVQPGKLPRTRWSTSANVRLIAQRRRQGDQYAAGSRAEQLMSQHRGQHSETSARRKSARSASGTECEEGEMVVLGRLVTPHPVWVLEGRLVTP